MQHGVAAGAKAGVRIAVLALALGMTAAWHLAAHAQDNAAALAPSALERAFTRAAPRPAWVEHLPLTRVAQPQGPWSIALSDAQLYLTAAAGSNATYLRRALEVHNASALDTVGRIDLDFLPAFQRLDLHGVAIVRDGQRLERLAGAQVRFLQRETALERGVYSGAVSVNIVVDDLRVGDILDLDYTVTGDNPVFGPKVIHGAPWNSNAQVGRRRVVLDAPATRPIAARLLGGSEPLPRSEQRDGRVRTIWDAAQLPAVDPDDHLPAGVHAQRWLQLSEFASWDEVNRWALELLPTAAGGPAFEALLARIRTAGTLEQQAVKALEFVQGEVRYLSLALGENSHRPAAPETVLARRYGDCKDKSQLLVALLKGLGIEAHVALLATAYPSGLDALLPSPGLFDHAIVQMRIGGRTYLLYPTRQGQHGSLARMGQAYAGHQLLVVRPGTRGLTSVAPAPQAAPSSRRIDRFELDRPGAAADLVVTRETGGVTAEAIRTWLAAGNGAQLAKDFAKGIAERYPEAVPVGELAIADDIDANRLRLTTRYRVPKLFRQDGTRWYMRWFAVNLQDTFHQAGSAARRHPLQASQLQPGELLEYEVDVHFRQTTGMLGATDTTALDDPAFAFRADVRQDPRSFNMHLRLRGAENRVETARLPAYTHKLNQLERHLYGSYMVPEAVLEASTIAPTPADQLRTRLAQLTTAVANAGFRALDPSATLCERAQVHQALGMSTEAINDAQEALRLQPKAPMVLVCRAEVHFAAGRFTQAEADFARALTLGADRPELYAGRALNAVYLAQLPLAVGQWQALLATAENDGQRLRAQIWLTLLGGRAASAWAPATGAEERWLALVLDLAGGGATRAEQVVAAATGDGGSGAPARLGETYFYLGRLAQSKGERFKALAYFQQALAKLAPDHPYHPAASHELARMKATKS